MNKINMIVVMLVGLYGCGNDQIDIVRKSYTQYDKTLTIEQAFDNRKVCKETKWSSFNDDRDRLIVEYKCYLNGVDEFYKKLTSNQKIAVENKYVWEKEDAKRLYDRHLDSQEYYTGIINKEENKKKVLEKKLAFASEEEKIVWEYGQSFYQSEKEQIQKQLKVIDDEILKYKRKIKSSEEIKVDYDNAIKKSENKKDSLNTKNESEGKYNITDVYETIQWAINGEKIPQILYTGIVFKNSNGNIIERKRNINTLLKLIYKNKATSIKNHWLVGKI